MEEDREFVYLALERCNTSLAQFINDQGGAALLTVRGGAVQGRLAERLKFHDVYVGRSVAQTA
jgi:hypothetical protein